MVSIYTSGSFVSFQVQANGTSRSVTGKTIAEVFAQFSDLDKSAIVGVATTILKAAKAEQETDNVVDDILSLLGISKATLSSK